MTAKVLSFNCPHCDSLVEVGESVLDETVVCPNEACGKPFRPAVPVAAPVARGDAADKREPAGKIEKPADDEAVVLKTRPSIGRLRPLRYSLLVLLMLAALAGVLASFVMGYGLAINDFEIMGPALLLLISSSVLIFCGFIYIGWWVAVLATTLTVTSERTILRRGIISRDTTEVRHDDVRNLQINQTLAQRLLGVGDIAISSAGQDDLEIVVAGIPAPSRVAEAVRNRQ